MILLRHIRHSSAERRLVTRDYNEIMASGELNVVTDYNSIGYFIAGDTAGGFQLEMMQALEREWGVKVHLFLENSLDENLEGLLKQRYDLVARNIPVNIQLKDTFAFTAPLTLNKQVLVQRKARYNGVLNLSGSSSIWQRRPFMSPVSRPPSSVWITSPTR